MKKQPVKFILTYHCYPYYVKEAIKKFVVNTDVFAVPMLKKWKVKSCINSQSIV